MEKILIIILQNRISVYRYSENNKFELFYINGEEYVPWQGQTALEDFTFLKNEILDILNLDNFIQSTIDIIYHQINSRHIKDLIEIIFPCEHYQIFDFEKVLPELLLKSQQLKVDTKLNVVFEGTNYLVSMDQEGNIEMSLTEDGAELEIFSNTIPTLLEKNYDFIINDQDIEIKNSKITNLIEENLKLKRQIDIAYKKLNQVLEQLDAKQTLIEKFEKKNSENIIKEKRQIIRVVKPKQKNNCDYILRMSPFSLPERIKKLTLKWQCKSGDLIKKNQNVVSVEFWVGEEIDNSIMLDSKTDGRIYILTNEEVVVEDQVIAVISDAADDIEDIRKWIAKM